MSVAPFVALAVRTSTPDSGEVEAFELAAVGGPDLGGAEWHSLVRTRKPLPYHIRIQWSVSESDLLNAPAPEAIAASLTALASGRPFVVAGGAAALAAVAALVPASPSSIYSLTELAELLDPGLGSYELDALVTRFGVASTGDGLRHVAKTVAAVFEGIWQRAAGLDALILNEIALRTDAIEWPLGRFFRHLAASLPAGLRTPPQGEGITLPAAPASETSRPLTGMNERQHVDPAEIVATLQCAAGASGRLEARPQQIEMAAAVAVAQDGDEHLIVEAGTGTGKSLAYLAPSACLALRNNTRVVISTNTINLQEQIVRKDIPDLREILASCGPQDLRERAAELSSVTLKGRRNYLCLQRLAVLRRTPMLTEPEVRFLVRILLWLALGQGRDRSELRLDPDEERLWSRVSAEGANCFATANYFVRTGACHLLRARRRAEAAHLVVVNHALLLSDVTAGRHILPSYEYLVVDEAHNLEDEATHQFGFHAGQADILALLDSILAREREKESGLIVDLWTAMRGNREAEEFAHLSGLLTEGGQRLDRARERVPETFGRLRAFVAQHAQTGGDYDNRLLLTQSKRAQPEWQQVEIAWENLRLALLQVEDSLQRIEVALAEGGGQGLLDAETLTGAAGNTRLSARILREGIEAIIDRHDNERVAWITVNRGSGIVGFSSAPLSVSELLDTYLFSRKASVVLTSATLSTRGDFEYVRQRLGLDEAVELAVGSPFDYRAAALVLLPVDMPEPNAPHYQKALEDALVDLCLASRGRALILFTSHSALRATYYATRGRLAAGGVRALAQGIDGQPKELLAALRAQGSMALFGTSSFWEGVDVAGDALSLLVIAKLPFSVPTDPVFSARAEMFEQPFRDFALPQAILRFKQGFGRLIRQRGDRGVVAVLDRRLLSKSYGRSFVESLPDCSLRQVPRAALAAATGQWLSLEPAVAAQKPRARRRSARG